MNWPETRDWCNSHGHLEESVIELFFMGYYMQFSWFLEFGPNANSNSNEIVKL